MRSTSEIYTQQYATRLTPETKQILARLSDDVLRLVHAACEAEGETERAAWEAEADHAACDAGPDGVLPRYEDPSGFRTRMRRNEPALNSLSDEELDVALDIVCHLGTEGHAAEEYFAESHEYMTKEERERMSIIASWAW